MNRVTAGQNGRIAPARLIEANMHSCQEKGEYSLYRGIFIGLIYLVYNNELKLAISLAIVSIIPLLSQGYNWMHNLWSAVLIPTLLVLLYGIFLTQEIDSWVNLNLQLVEQEIKFNLWFILAGSLGWLTHILIDKTFISPRERER